METISFLARYALNQLGLIVSASIFMFMFDCLLASIVQAGKTRGTKMTCIVLGEGWAEQ